jgi:hypothetical protein
MIKQMKSGRQKAKNGNVDDLILPCRNPLKNQYGESSQTYEDADTAIQDSHLHGDEEQDEARRKGR